jgi:hypothetical protein
MDNERIKQSKPIKSRTTISKSTSRHFPQNTKSNSLQNARTLGEKLYYREREVMRVARSRVGETIVR